MCIQKVKIDIILNYAGLFSYLITILLLFSANADAQVPENQKISAESFRPAFGITGNYSPNSFTVWGKMQNTRQSQLMLTYLHSKINLGKLSLNLATEIIATSWIRYPIDGVNGFRENVFGLGFIPARFHIPLSKKTNGLFLTASGGFMVFNRVFPSNKGTRFNYVLDTGIGYQFYAGEKTILQAGYKLKHLSNGNTGESNPGIDSQNIFIGILFTL